MPRCLFFAILFCCVRGHPGVSWVWSFMCLWLSSKASSAYPRTYTSLLDCLQKAQRVDMEEDSQGDDGHQPHLDDFIRDDENWLRCKENVSTLVLFYNSS